MNKEQMLHLLHDDVVPALGCTEPVCVALCAACAAAVLQGPVTSVEAEVSAGIYKNGMSAGIPHCSKTGLPHAAALGACLRNPQRQLLLLEDLTEDILQQAECLVQQGAVHIGVTYGTDNLYVSCTLRTETEEASCTIQGSHTNITCVSKNSTVVYAQTSTTAARADSSAVEQLAAMTLAQIRALVDSASEEELAFLTQGAAMNEALAAYSQTIPTGVGLGDALRRSDLLPQQALLSRIVTQVASAAESRLDGCPLPTMSSSGAGTKGLVVILPVWETAKALQATDLQTVRALALAHLINRYINCHIGKLSPMCSCVMASSTAASAAMTYLMGGNDQQISHAVRNMVGTVSGMICDGGKVGCALKVATGSSAALLCAITATADAALRPTDGICADTAEACIQNLAELSSLGMQNTDAAILQIMTQKQL